MENKGFRLFLSIFIAISTLTFLVSSVKTYSLPSVLGTATSSAKVYDDGNETLYIEYSASLDLYNSLSAWQGRNPGRTIYSSSPVSTGSAKYFAIIFSYIGK